MAGVSVPADDRRGGPAELRDTERPELSVVVPVYRTGWALPELARRLDETLAAADRTYELLVVDDASPDDALANARTLAEADPRVRVVSLERNVGQNRAVLHGIRAARGRWVVTLDGDLQDPPEAIPRLLARAEQGHDAVFATRTGRYQSRARMWSSRAFKGLLHQLFGLPRGAGLYLLLHRELADRVAAAAGRRPSVVVLAGLEASSAAGVPVERAVRPRGRSAYSAWGRLVAGGSALACGLRHRRRRIAAGSPLPLVACFLAATAVAAALSLPRPFDFGDEGFRLLLSADWARGVRLFDTYRLQYIPGQYVLYGTLFRVLGDGYVAGRLAGATMVGASSALVFWVVRRLAGVGWAWLAGLGVAVAAFPRPATLASTLVLVAAVDLGLRATGPRRRAPGEPEEPEEPKEPMAPVGPGWVVGVAALAGLTAGVREDAAVLLAALAVVAVVARRRPGDLLRLVLPAAVVGFIPWVAVFAARGEGGAFVAWVVHRMLFLGERLADPTRPGWAPAPHPLSSLHALKMTLFPLLAASPVALYLALAGRELLRWWRSRSGPAATRTISPISPVLAAWTPALGAALAGAAHLPQFLWERPDITHFRYHAHLEIAVAVILLATLAPRRRRAGAVAGTAVVCLLGAALVGGRLEESVVRYPAAAGRGTAVPVKTRPPAWAPLPAREGETLIVLDWGPGWYAVEGLPAGTRYLYTGVRNDLDRTQIAELATDLAAPSNRWVISRSLDGTPPPVRRTLERCYREQESWQGWRLWRRVKTSPDEAALPRGASGRTAGLHQR